jgi:hypothetical protein
MRILQTINPVKPINLTMGFELIIRVHQMQSDIRAFQKPVQIKQDDVNRNPDRVVICQNWRTQQSTPGQQAWKNFQKTN